MVVSNVDVFNLEKAIKSSKYPMATDADIPSSDMTETVKRLGSAPRGSAHDNFLHGILVTFDLTFTVKAWTEAERYHFLEIISSMSTMHRLSKFDLDNQYIEYVDPRVIAIMNELKDKYNTTKDPEDYLRLLYTNPTGFKLTAGMSTNYGQLKTIYNQRHNHRLPEWREFCQWVLTLPHFCELTGIGVQQ